MKRTLVILLTLLGMIPDGYCFDYDFEVDGICYEISSSHDLTVMVVARDRLVDGAGYTDLGDVVIPSTVSNNGIEYTVTRIEEKAFRLNNSLTSISLPNTITSIGRAAFYRCYSLTHINLPESLTKIMDDALCFSGIQGDLVIPKNLKQLGRAFVECKGVKTIYYNAEEATYAENATKGPLSEYAEQIIFGDSVKSIPSHLCNGLYKITTVTIPPCVTSIGKNVFDGCTNLKSLTWNATHYPTSIRIPSSINQLTIGEDVEVIPPTLAYESAITSIVIPDNVTSIGGSAFQDCVNLTSVTLGNSLTSLGPETFANCSQLASISIPSSVTEIPRGLFMGCSSLASFAIPSSITTISNNAFYECSSLASITIPSSVTSIKSDAFLNCTGLMSIEVEAGNTVYDSRDNCNAIIETATNTLMTGCRNTVIPNTVVTIGQAAFARHAEITQIEIPNSVTSINNSAFSGCTGLTEITLPESLTSIGSWAFCNCTGLTKITSLAQRPPTIIEGETLGTFKGVSKQTPVYVPKGYKPVYWVADGWKEFANIYELDEVPVTNKCDVNGDGKVDVSDVNMVINAMLGK